MSAPIGTELERRTQLPTRMHIGRAFLRSLGLTLLAAVLFDVGVRGGVANAVVAVGLVVVVVVLLSCRRVGQREARALVYAALIPTVFLMFRSSPWLAVSNLIAIVGLLVAGVLYARTGSVFDSAPRRLLRRGTAAVAHIAARLRAITAPRPRLRHPVALRLARVGKAIAVAAPMLAVVVVLLASADAVFASFLTPDLPVGNVIGHVALVALFGLAVLGAATAAGAGPSERNSRGRFGVTEAATMLGLAAGVLGLFVASQLVALTDAGRRLVENAGLTPAEYARSGFFQLWWATGLVLAFLAVVRALTIEEARRRRVVLALGALVPLLALGLVAVSLRRMALYDKAFGLTMLRLWVVGATVWMALLLVMTAARNLGLGPRRQWLVAGAGAAFVALVLAANLANPEAFVVRHNIGRANDGVELDVEYLRGLSDDATPAITTAVDSERDAYLRIRLRGALRCSDGATGVTSLNLAVQRAAAARERACR